MKECKRYLAEKEIQKWLSGDILVFFFFNILIQYKVKYTVESVYQDKYCSLCWLLLSSTFESAKYHVRELSEVNFCKCSGQNVKYWPWILDILAFSWPKKTTMYSLVPTTYIFISHKLFTKAILPATKGKKYFNYIYMKLTYLKY